MSEFKLLIDTNVFIGLADLRRFAVDKSVFGFFGHRKSLMWIVRAAQKSLKVAVVKTLGIFKTSALAIIGSHVSALDDSEEGRQTAPLLERC
jgi:hypothetical protein